MPLHVAKRLLGHAIGANRDVRRDTARDVALAETDGNSRQARGLLRVRPQRHRQPEVVHDPGVEPAHDPLEICRRLLDMPADRVGVGGQGRRRGAQASSEQLELELKRVQPRADVIVEVGGDLAALLLLGAHEPP